MCMLRQLFVHMDLATSTRFFSVMPNSSMTASPGAEKPNLSVPMTLPSSPTYLYHRPVTPASMAIRLVQLEGSTKALEASIAHCSSDPDDKMIISRSLVSLRAT